jgi:hypothetical protein
MSAVGAIHALGTWSGLSALGEWRDVYLGLAPQAGMGRAFSADEVNALSGDK